MGGAEGVVWAGLKGLCERGSRGCVGGAEGVVWAGLKGLCGRG